MKQAAVKWSQKLHLHDHFFITHTSIKKLRRVQQLLDKTKAAPAIPPRVSPLPGNIPQARGLSRDFTRFTLSLLNMETLVLHLHQFFICFLLLESSLEASFFPEVCASKSRGDVAGATLPQTPQPRDRRRSHTHKLILGMLDNTSLYII